MTTLLKFKLCSLPLADKRFVPAVRFGRRDAGDCLKTQERGMFAVCNAGVSPAELEPDSQFGRRGRRRYKAFSDSLAGVTKSEMAFPIIKVHSHMG